jgi:integrase/recombinase XerD
MIGVEMADITISHEPPTRRNTTLPDNATDSLVIAMWLKQRPATTQEAYQGDIKALFDFTAKPLQALTLLDLQNFAESLQGQKPATIARKLSAVKSLLTFCYKSGYTSVNVGAALRLPKIQERLAERIMSESQVQRLLALEPDKRNHALLRVMYNAGLRVSEVIALTWNDVQDNPNGGQVRVFGKGGKERYSLISQETYEELLELRGNALDFAPVFQSRKSTKSGFLERGQVNRIVEDAAIRAGIAVYTEVNKDGQEVKRSRVSPHWIRHAHASHAIERGAPLPLVRDTLGHSSIATTNKYSHARPGASSGTYLPI